MVENPTEKNREGNHGKEMSEQEDDGSSGVSDDAHPHLANDENTVDDQTCGDHRQKLKVGANQSDLTDSRVQNMATNEETPVTPTTPQPQQPQVITALYDDDEEAYVEGEYVHLPSSTRIDGVSIRPRKLHLEKQMLLLRPTDLNHLRNLQKRIQEKNFDRYVGGIASVTDDDLRMLTEFVHPNIMLLQRSQSQYVNNNNSSSSSSAQTPVGTPTRIPRSIVPSSSTVNNDGSTTPPRPSTSHTPLTPTLSITSPTGAARRRKSQSRLLQERIHAVNSPMLQQYPSSPSAANTSPIEPLSPIINIPTPNFKMRLQMQRQQREMVDQQPMQHAQEESQQATPLRKSKRRRLVTTTAIPRSKRAFSFQEKPSALPKLSRSEWFQLPDDGYIEYDKLEIKHDVALDYDMDSEDEQWLEQYNATRRPAHAPLTDLQFERIYSIILREALTKGGYASVQTVQHMVNNFAYNAGTCGVTRETEKFAHSSLSDIFAVKNHFVEKNSNKLKPIRRSENHVTTSESQYYALQRLRLEFERLRILMELLRKRSRIKHRVMLQEYKETHIQLAIQRQQQQPLEEEEKGHKKKKKKKKKKTSNENSGSKRHGSGADDDNDDDNDNDGNNGFERSNDESGGSKGGSTSDRGNHPSSSRESSRGNGQGGRSHGTRSKGDQNRISHASLNENGSRDEMRRILPEIPMDFFKARVVKHHDNDVLPFDEIHPTVGYHYRDDDDDDDDQRTEDSEMISSSVPSSTTSPGDSMFSIHSSGYSPHHFDHMNDGDDPFVERDGMEIVDLSNAHEQRTTRLVEKRHSSIPLEEEEEKDAWHNVGHVEDHVHHLNGHDRMMLHTMNEQANIPMESTVDALLDSTTDNCFMWDSVM